MNRSEEIKQIWGEMTDDERRQYADSLSDTEFSGVEQLDKYAGTNYEPAFTERIDRSDAAYRAALQSLSPGEQRAAKSVGMAGEIGADFGIPGGAAKGLGGVLYTGAV